MVRRRNILVVFRRDGSVWDFIEQDTTLSGRVSKFLVQQRDAMIADGCQAVIYEKIPASLCVKSFPIPLVFHRVDNMRDYLEYDRVWP